MGTVRGRNLYLTGFYMYAIGNFLNMALFITFFRAPLYFDKI
jgi:hypothetical protein